MNQSNSIYIICKSVFYILGVVILSTACHYDSKEFLYPKLNNECDTLAVTYANSVAPLLNQYCYSCHSNSNAPTFGSNIQLEEYASLRLSVDNGSLNGAIKHVVGFSPMPKGGGKMPECSILIIDKWIKEGAQNN